MYNMIAWLASLAKNKRLNNWSRDLDLKTIEAAYHTQQYCKLYVLLTKGGSNQFQHFQETLLLEGLTLQHFIM